jgi:hypothetical protein
VPLVITLPPGIGAVDFYIDLAIDCVNTTDVTVRAILIFSHSSLQLSSWAGIWQPLPAACPQDAPCLFWQQKLVIIIRIGGTMCEGGSVGENGPKICVRNRDNISICLQVPCDVSVATWPLPLVVRKNVSSICASAEVGQYFGFYDHSGMSQLVIELQ